MNKKIIKKQSEEVTFGIKTTLNIKITVIEIKHYQLKNTLITFGHN